MFEVEILSMPGVGKASIAVGWDVVRPTHVWTHRCAADTGM
jgi:hypothetical protein